ncbi:MAG: hypothetical protein K9H16_07250 [Bacteroidales bacterium]|nr:hypothetical protein [Bacteroidales bacterium]
MLRQTTLERLGHAVRLYFHDMICFMIVDSLIDPSCASLVGMKKLRLFVGFGASGALRPKHQNLKNPMIAVIPNEVRNLI